jgi:hypothetical protein
LLSSSATPTVGNGWISSALGIGWLILGWFALIAGRGYWASYFVITLMLMGAFFPLLF